MASKNQYGFSHLIPVIVAVLLVAGAGFYVYKQNSSTKTANSETQSTDTSLVKPLPDDLLSPEQIKQIAEDNKTGDASVTGIELEREGETLKFRVKLSDGSFLLFNAKSGVLISKGNTTEAEAELEDLPASLKVAISFDKARSIALAAKPDGVIRMLKLEKEEGKVVYSVRFTDGSKIDLDASSGEIIRKTGKTEDKSKPGGENDDKKSSTNTSSDDGADDDSADDRSGSNSGSNSGSISGGSGSGSEDSGGHGSDDD